MHQNFMMILIQGWKEIGCKPYHPQSNGLVERMVQTIKTELKACSQQKEKIEVFLPRLLLSYHTIPHAGRLESSSALMGGQIRALLTMLYSINEKLLYKKNNKIQGRIYLAKRSQYNYNKQKRETVY